MCKPRKLPYHAIYDRYESANVLHKHIGTQTSFELQDVWVSTTMVDLQRALSARRRTMVEKWWMVLHA